MTPTRFGIFFLLGLTLPAIAGAALGQTPTPMPGTECEAVTSSDKTITVTKYAPTKERCATPSAKITRIEDMYLGLVCTPADDKMTCSAFEPTEYSPAPDVNPCVSMPDVKAGSFEIQASVWSSRGSCTSNPLPMIPYRVVRVGIMGGTVCLEPGGGCASLKTLLPAGQQRLMQMGLGGAFQKLFEEIVGKPDEQRG